MRDGFSKAVTRAIAERAGYRCSNPTCLRLTSRPNPSNPESGLNVGVAAHIAAASPGGPRYDANQTPAQRGSAENGLWLCATCARLIDDAPKDAYPTNALVTWKTYAEAAAARDSQSGRVEIQDLIERIEKTRRQLLTFSAQWNVHTPVDFRDFQGSVARANRRYAEQATAWNLEVAPLIADLLIRLARLLGDSAPLVLELQKQAVFVPVNALSMERFAERLQIIRTMLELH
jgi:hypothetical protein